MERLMANKTKATPQKEEMWDKGPEIYPAAFLSLWTELTPIKLKAIIAAFKRLRPCRRMNVHPAVFFFVTAALARCCTASKRGKPTFESPDCGVYN